MRILVTGGYGFVGVNLIGRLLEDGWTVRVLDDGSTSDVRNLEASLRWRGLGGLADVAVETRDGDVTDYDRVQEAAKGCRAVAHLAAETDVTGSVADPLPNYRANALGTAHLLEGARRAGADTFVFASSNAAVGDASPPMHERIPPSPASPYGAGKLAGEGLVSAFAHSYGMHAISLRFANVYGPHSMHKGSVVARFLHRLAGGETLMLYGQGRPTRDYVHVDDIVDAVRTGLERGEPGAVYQVGSGVETSVRELVRKLEQATGYTARTEDAPLRTGEIARNFSDVSRAERELGWRSSVSLDDGLAETWSWFREAWWGDGAASRG